jgi:hypothetical protein
MRRFDSPDKFKCCMRNIDMQLDEQNEILEELSMQSSTLKNCSMNIDN